MTLTKVVIMVSIFAILLTVIEQQMGKKVIKNFFLSLLQNFVGGFFIFSGAVKAMDPLGTAYKMNDYYAEFESTFGGLENVFSSLAPMFATFAEYSVATAVFLIVFEIVLGISLLLGSWPKWTAWLLFLLVAFFTVLTGYTYLTGYVPSDVNFFEFAKWGEYEETNRKVTDCGCFGDFLVLEPQVTFMKDLALLIPGLIFLFASSQFHQLFTRPKRNLILVLSTLALLVYCFSNYVWDIPHKDMRPFKVDTNIAERKALEEEAENNVKVLAYKMTNKSTGEQLELAFDEYLKEYAKYPAEEWDLVQVKTEPEIPRTKISDFEASDLGGSNVTYEMLSHEGQSFMITAYKLYGSEYTEKVMVPDSIFVTDTIINELDTLLSPRLSEVKQKEVNKTIYTWEEGYLAKWKADILPLIEAAKSEGIPVYCFTAYSDPSRIQAFRNELGIDIPFLTGDDLLLKTIVRSNPGIVLLEKGKILNKWHHKKIPTFGEIQADYFE